MTSAEKYVLAAYLVVLATVLAYVVIFGAKLSRLERELTELAERARARNERQAPKARVPEETAVG